MKYSVKTGIWKTIKNGLVFFTPSILAGALAFIEALPPEVKIEHAMVIGLVLYFAKNYKENKDNR